MQKKNILYFIIGLFFLLLGIIGVFLPVMPTTPFVICATYFFGKSSPKFEAWLKYKSVFGPSILAWEKHRSIPLKAKIIATVFLTGSFILILSHPIMLPVKIFLCLILLGSAAFIHSRPSS